MVSKPGFSSGPSTPVRSIPARLGTPNSPSRPSTPRSVASWKSGHVRHIAQQVVQPLIKQASSLVHAYMVCGLNRDPLEWLVAPKPASGRPQRTAGAIGVFISPQILGSIPPHEKDEETVQTFAVALKAAFPNDCEICVGAKPPPSTCHSFVLQMSPTRSLYGVALRLWVRSDRQRLSKISSLLEANDFTNLSSSTSVWIPYCISYMSHYPLFDLMSDYIRCSWTLWSKQPDRFNNEGVMRLMKMPPPKPDQFLRLAVDQYTLCYQIPSLSSNFQNFPLWPVFVCLSAEHLVAVMEAALSPHGRIILTSQHAAILTVVSETLRFYLRSWSGLYVPVVYGRHAQGLVDEPAPYILGITKQSRPLYNAPKDALVVDLDKNRIFTARPPGSLSQRQRIKYASLLEQAVQGVSVEGVPDHLKSAYERNTGFSALGGMLAEDTTQWVKEPAWWDHSRVLSAVTNVCEKVRRNFRLLAVWKNMTQNTKVRGEDVAKIVHERNNIARNLDEAWREYINFKQRAETKIVSGRQTEAKLNSELLKQKTDFAELSECTEQLIEETKQLQASLSSKTRDLNRLEKQLNDKTTHARQMSNHVQELQGELHAANVRLKAQQKLLDELEMSRDNNVLSQERDDAQRAVIHLTSLISGQVAHIERVMASLTAPSRPVSQTDMRKEIKRQSMRRSPSPASPGLHRASSRRSTVDSSDKRLNLAGLDESVDDRVRVVSEIVRKINNQCFAAIEDLASKRNKASDSMSDGVLTPVPELDSRAETRQSGRSVADPLELQDIGGAVRIQAIAEEGEDDNMEDRFMDSSNELEKEVSGSFNDRSLGLSMPLSA